MSSALSICAAAREHPKREALIAGKRSYTYEELAQLSTAMELGTPNVHRAPNCIETALLLYASLEAHLPLAFVSASATETELAEARERMQGATLDETALVLFTSGSSGRSKGVRLGARALAASATAAGKVLGWAESDRWLCCLPLSHIGGLSVLLRCLVARRTAVLHEMFDPVRVTAALTEERITQISLVPTMLWRLLEHGTMAPRELRITLIGGAALDATLAKRAGAHGFRLRPSYGMTETSSMVVCDGHPIPGVQIETRDDGRLLIRGPMIMQGYLPPDDETNAFVGEWFKTSDRARFDEQGHLQILGRSDATIISGGENVDLTAVESAVCAHPRVRACLAVGVPDPEWGQRLVALVVCDGDAGSLIVDSLRGHTRPKQFITVPELPLLENGKPDRQAALRLALSMQS